MGLINKLIEGIRKRKNKDAIVLIILTVELGD